MPNLTPHGLDPKFLIFVYISSHRYLQTKDLGTFHSDSAQPLKIERLVKRPKKSER